MAYATIEELASALNKRVTPEMETALQVCLDAAAREIDHEVDWTQPPRTVDDAGDLALLNRVNLARGVEWWKANDAAFGVIGFDQTGALRAPTDGFKRHAGSLLPLKEQWPIA